MCVCIFFSPRVVLFILYVLFLSSVQSGWPLWIEGRADSTEKVDWWLIVQPDSARPNWLGCDPALAQCPLILFFFIFSSLFFSPSVSISSSTSVTLTHIQTCTVHKYTCTCRLYTHFLPLPPLVFFAALNSSLLPSFILGRFLSSFLCPLCFLCHCSFRTGFVPWVISSGFILQPLFIQVWNTGHFQEMHQKGV